MAQRVDLLESSYHGRNLSVWMITTLDAAAANLLIGSSVVITSMTRVMVEGFLKEYLSVGAVIGTELHTVGCYFSGFLSASGLLVNHRALKDYFGDRKPDIGIGSSSVYDHLFISLCKGVAGNLLGLALIRTSLLSVTHGRGLENYFPS